MSASIRLTRTLAIAIDALKSGAFSYDWNDGPRCNCGVVVCAGLGISPKELDEKLGPYANTLEVPTWSNVITYACPVSGMSTDELFQQLEAIGMARDDFYHLEYLSDPAILEKAGFAKIYKRNFPKFWQKTQIGYKVDYKVKEDLIKYLEGWVDLIADSYKDKMPLVDLFNTHQDNPPTKVLFVHAAAKPMASAYRISDN